MKKLLALLATFAFVMAPLSAFAATYTTSPTSVAGHGSHGHNVTIPDATFEDTDTQRQDWGAGLGLDVVLYRGDGPLTQVKFENRYDIQNREYRGFVVGELDLFSQIKNLVG